MSENYIRNHFDEIKSKASVIEKRLDDDITLEGVLLDNKSYLSGVKAHDLDYIYIDQNYQIDFDI